MPNRPEKPERSVYPIAAAALSVAVALICLFFLVPQVDTNDDFTVHAMTSLMYGVSTPFLNHVGVGYGLILQLLQRLAPALNWFTVLSYFFLMLSFTTFGVAAARRNGRNGFLAAAALTLAFAPYAYNLLHYTRTAMICGLIGFLLIFYALESPKTQKVFLWIGVALTMVSAAMRLPAFFAAAVFGLVAGLFALDFKAKSLKSWFAHNRRLVVTFVLLFVFLGAGQLFNRIAPRLQPESKAFYEYIQARIQVSDYVLPDFDGHYDAYQKLGVTRNDLALIDEWNFGDTDYFSTEKLEAIYALRAPVPLAEIAGRFARDLPLYLYRDPLACAALALFAAALAVCKKRGRWMAVCFFAAYLLTAFYQAGIGRTTRWVRVGLIFCFAISLVWCLLQGVEAKPKRWVSFVFVGLAAAATVFGAVTYYPEHAGYRAYFEQEKLEIYHTLGADADTLYLADFSTLPLVDRLIPTFSGAPDNLMRNVYLLGGWDTGSAARNSILERFDVTSPYRALTERRDVVLVDRDNYLKKAVFIREHIGRAACYAIIDVVDSYYILDFALPFAAMTPSDYNVTAFAVTVYEPDNNFDVLRVTVDRTLPDGIVFLELTPPNGAPLTFRATRDSAGKTEIAAIVPMFDLGAASYEVRVLVETSAAVLSSPAFPARIE